MMNPDKKLELLKEFEILRCLPELFLKQLVQNGRDVILKADELLFEEGSPGQTMYFILEGKLGVYKNDKYIVSRHKNEFFGEMALIDYKPRSATVKALEDSFLLEINEDLFNSHLKSNLEVVMELLKTLSSRSREELIQISRESQKLKSQKLLFSNISKVLDNPNHEVFICDPKTFKINHVNSNAIKNLGYSSDELGEMTLLALLPEIMHENISNLIDYINKEENDSPGLSATFNRKNDTTYPVQIRFEKFMGQASDQCVVLAKVLLKNRRSRDETEKKLDFKSTSQPSCREMTIKILSVPNLQNDLLTSLLEKETGLKSFSLETSKALDSFLASNEEASFFLLDFMSMNKDQGS